MGRCLLCGTTVGGTSVLKRIGRQEDWWFRGRGYTPSVQAHLLQREGKVVRVAAPAPVYGRWALTPLGEAALVCVHRWSKIPPSAVARRGEARSKLARVTAVASAPTPPPDAVVPGRIGRTWVAGCDTVPIVGDIHTYLRTGSWKSRSPLL